MGVQSLVDGLWNMYVVLHLIYHRNKNQHRQGHWWKWLSMLKRCVRNLSREFAGKEFSRAHARIKYMKHILLPKCYV